MTNRLVSPIRTWARCRTFRIGKECHSERSEKSLRQSQPRFLAPLKDIEPQPSRPSKTMTVRERRSAAESKIGILKIIFPRPASKTHFPKKRCAFEPLPAQRHSINRGSKNMESSQTNLLAPRRLQLVNAFSAHLPHPHSPRHHKTYERTQSKPVKARFSARQPALPLSKKQPIEANPISAMRPNRRSPRRCSCIPHTVARKNRPASGSRRAAGGIEEA